MNSIFRKLVPLIVIASMLLAACGGGVQAPDAIDWGEGGEPVEFEFDYESGVEIDENDPALEFYEPVPWDELFRDEEGEEDLLDCTQEQILAYECFGDRGNGYKCIDGTCYMFYNDEAYRLDESEAEQYRRQVLGAQIASLEVDSTGMTIGGIVVGVIGGIIAGPVGIAIAILGGVIAIGGVAQDDLNDALYEYGRKGGADYELIDESELDAYRID